MRDFATCSVDKSNALGFSKLYKKKRARKTGSSSRVERVSEFSLFDPLCNILEYWHFLGAVVGLMLDFFVRSNAC